MASEIYVAMATKTPVPSPYGPIHSEGRSDPTHAG
jgi:hypothetical protein